MKAVFISIAIFIFAVVFQNANCLKCYECTNCGSLSSATIRNCSAGEVCQSATLSIIVTTTNKGCSNNCSAVSIGGLLGSTCCSTDLCNSSPIIQVPRLATTTAIFMAIMFYAKH